MNRHEVTQKMLNMGFAISHKGFGHIVEALEMIDKEGEGIKFTAMYALIAKNHCKDKSAVERCIRWEIERYYNECKAHPYLLADHMKNGRYPTKEFLMRLYLIIYKPEFLEGGENHA